MSHDFAEEILRRRPLFLVFLHVHEYGFPEVSTTGLFWSEQNALRTGLKHLLSKLTYNHYDRSKRSSDLKQLNIPF